MNNRIESFKHFPHLLFLRELHLDGNRISNFEHFPSLFNRKYHLHISIQNNRITSFKGFPTILHLSELNVRNNQITSFEHFNFIVKYIVIHDNPITSYKGISLENFKKTSMYGNFSEYLDDVLEKVISRDINEHKEAIIKNENEEDVFVAELAVKLYSNHSVDALCFLIQNNLKKEYTFEEIENNIMLENLYMIISNKDFIESICLKYDNDVSKEMVKYIKEISKKKLENGDAIYF
jgi:hypothetical protein